MLSVGSNDTVLTADSGEGTGIKWAAAAGGGGSLTFIQTNVADDDATLGVTGVDATYDGYMLEISDIVPASNDVDLYLRMGDSGGIDSGASDYTYYLLHLNPGYTTNDHLSSTGATRILIANNTNYGGVGNAAGEGACAQLFMTLPGDATMRPQIYGHSAHVNGSGSSVGHVVWGNRQAHIAVTQFEIHFNTGNIKTGRMTLHGVKHS